LTLGDLIKRIRTKIGNIGLDDVPFFHDQYVSAINDAIRSLRVQYIQNGLGNEFVETETFIALNPDENYPFLNYEQLSNPILRSLPTSLTVRASFVARADMLEPITASFSKGDRRVKENGLYEALQDIDQIDTYNGTVSVDRLRTFYPNNGLTFFEGDIVKSDDLYYVATQEYENNTDTPIEDVDAFERAYWKRIGDGYVQAKLVPFDSLQLTKLQLPQSYPFSVSENNLWTGFDNVPFIISYIPEWQEVRSPNTELSVPDSMLPTIQQFSIQNLIGVGGDDEQDDT